MKRKNWLRRLAAAAMAIATVCTLGISAFAAEAQSLPDTTSPRTLTIYKYDNADAATTRGNGNYANVNTTTHRPMKNVIFDVYYYADLDSNVPKSISESDANTWAKNHQSALKATLTTDSNGRATWSAATGKAADGIYLVVERDNRAIQYTGKADPFFVSLPYTDTDSASWIYNVVVQPKNTLVPGPEVNKDVESIDNEHASARVNEPITWILRGDVPADLYYTDAVYNQVVEFYADKYTFTDVIDPQLTYEGNLKVELYEQNGHTTDLTSHPEYFTVSGNASKDNAGGTLIVSLTQAGMKAVTQHYTTCGVDPENCEIRVYFDTSINTSAITGDEITNDVTLDYTNSTGLSYDPVTVPSNEIPEVHVGGFMIEKVDVANPSTKLAGAEFHVATSEANALAGEFLTTYEGNEIKLVTDVTGKASYTGVPFDNQSTDPQAGTYYWLVETKAPEGYQLNSTPTKITVNADTYRATTVPYVITNATKFDLPLTGGNGASTFLLIGLMVMGVACVTVAFTVRSKKAKAN